MKKLSFSLAVLLSSFSLNTFASSFQDCCTVPMQKSGLLFSIAGLNWRPATEQLDFVLETPVDSIDNIAYKSVDPDFSWGYKAAIGYKFGCSANDILLTYTKYNQNRHANVVPHNSVLTSSITGTSDIVVPIGPAFLLTNVTFYTANFDLGDIVLPLDASASATFNTDVYDLSFGQNILIGKNASLRFQGGLRYASLKHNFDTHSHTSFDGIVPLSDESLLMAFNVVISPITLSINFDVLSELNEIVHQSSEFNGIGPRFGLSGTYNLGCGFGVSGGASTSLLVGDISSNFLDVVTNNLSVVQAGDASFSIPVDVSALTGDYGSFTDGLVIRDEMSADTYSYEHPKELRVIPNIDANLGLNYTYQFKRDSYLRVEVGYMTSHYWNCIDRLSLTGAFAPEVRTRKTEDTNFDGPYVALQVSL